MLAGPAWEPGSAAAGEVDVPPRLRELLRDLTPGLAAAHNEHGPIRERLRGSVALDVDLEDAGRERRGLRRPVWPLVRAGRQHNGARIDRPGGRLEAKAVAAGLQRADVHALLHRKLETRRVALEEPDDVVARVEPVRIRAIVRLVGEPHAPVRRDETEALPASSPALADLGPLQHDVLEPATGELAACRETRLAGADDDDVEHESRGG